MFVKRLQQKLAEAKRSLDASSCTLYLRDPHWPDEFRLIGMAGVWLEEPMYGFVSPDSARRTIVEGDLEIFSTNTRKDERLCEPGILMDGIPEDNRVLFCDFVQREGVQSSARLIHTDNSGARDAILFVNFSRRVRFDGTLKTKIRLLLEDVLSDVGNIQQEVIRRDVEWLSEATKIVSPAWSAANIDFRAEDKPDPYFTKIIQASLSALRITPEKGLGTIHLYNAEEHMLELRGSSGAILHPERAKRHSVKTGQGVVSWVVLRRKALLIPDLEKSEFRRIHVWLNEDVKSELAVPLEAGGELVGVMCLECTEAKRFLPRHVRSVWYAANRAAIVYQLHQQVSMNRRLLELIWTATGAEHEAHTSLDDVAELAREYLKGSFCDIWWYDRDAERFDKSGASYKNFVPQIRSGGWTEFIQRSKYPIWIGNIKQPTDFSVHHWDSSEWIQGTPTEDCPKELNPVPLDQGVKSELGIPITVGEDCIGVAWIKYRRERLECPKPGLLSLALRYAAQAGLVLDSIQRHRVDLKERKSIDDVGEQIFAAIRSRWQLDCCELLDAHVISHAFHSKLGGDFYARKKIDDKTVGILLLDGTGHGVEGSLHMLPLMTAFESFWQSYSTAHVINQLTKTSEAVGAQGTAIYCIFSVIDNKRWLSATSAGHESLILFKKSERGLWLTDYFPRSHGPMLGSPLKEPLMGHSIELSRGDIVVGYTDGVAEGHEEGSEYFNANHIINSVQRVLAQRGDNPKGIAEAIMQESQEKHPRGFEDDATVFVVRLK